MKNKHTAESAVMKEEALLRKRRLLRDVSEVKRREAWEYLEKEHSKLGVSKEEQGEKGSQRGAGRCQVGQGTLGHGKSL